MGNLRFVWFYVAAAVLFLWFFYAMESATKTCNLNAPANARAWAQQAFVREETRIIPRLNSTEFDVFSHDTGRSVTIACQCAPNGRCEINN